MSLLPVFIVLSLLRIEDFKERQHSIAESTTAQVAKMISTSIADRQRLVKLFAEEHIKLISQLADSPNDDEVNQKLANKIKRYFPDYFAFSLADKNGNLLLDDFDGFIGDVCIADIKHYVDHGIHKTRIHPNPYEYHFDVIAEWNHLSQDGLLFISFKPDIFAQVLAATEPAGHQLILTIEEQDHLIEITSVGHRQKLTDRLDFRMQPNELKQILTLKNIDFTFWNIADLLLDKTYEKHIHTIYRQMGTIYGLFAIVIIILWTVLRKYEIQRSKLTETLTEKNKILEDENTLALKVYKKITESNNEHIDKLKSYQSPMHTFSGDVILSYGKNINRFYVLLGDFTGHGLGAALGAIPLTETFFAMAKKQFDITDIIRSCNQKLLSTLPTERFCCTALVEWNRDKNTLKICNAGLPPITVFNSEGKILEKVKSSMPPLGCFPLSDDIEVTMMSVDDDQHLLMYTDGIMEAMNENKDMFGQERILNCVSQAPAHQLNEKLLNELNLFTGSSKQKDDISILTLSLNK